MDDNNERLRLVKMIKHLKDYKIILASNSPRRKELLSALDIPFEIRIKEGIDESYPPTLPTTAIAEYISRKKSSAYTIADNELLITADTIVVLGREVLGKPININDAKAMLAKLSGKTHQVITGCCLRTNKREKLFSVTSDVTFSKLSTADITYYVDHYKPLDKAGAYGVQEWIGCIGVSNINGSYFNVMGLPVQRLYEALQEF